MSKEQSISNAMETGNSPEIEMRVHNPTPPKANAELTEITGSSRKSLTELIAHQSEIKEETRHVIESNMGLMQRMNEVEAGLQQDMAKNLKTILSLENKMSSSQTKIRFSLDLYTKLQEAQRNIQDALTEAKMEYTKETKQYAALSHRLHNIQSKRLGLEEEVTKQSVEFHSRIAELKDLIDQRMRVESIIARLEAENPANINEAFTQTSVGSDVFHDIDVMRAQMRVQGRNLRDIRKSVDLVKRCS